MIRPDFRDFKRRVIVHSAKGSEWEKHKYIKAVDGKYYYPDDYEGGRHLPKNGKDGNGKPSKLPEDTKDKKTSSKKKTDKTETSAEMKAKLKAEEIAKKSNSQLALDIISGKMGNLSQYKKELGARYDDVQRKVEAIANKSNIVDASKKETTAKAEAFRKNKKNISAPQKTKTTYTKEEMEEKIKEERLNGKKLTAKEIIEPGKKKEEPRTIQNQKKTNSMADRAKAASNRTTGSKAAETIVNRNYSKELEKAKQQEEKARKQEIEKEIKKKEEEEKKALEEAQNGSSKTTKKKTTTTKKK